MKFLKLRENCTLSMSCEYFSNCYKLLWLQNDYFSDIDTEVFDNKEI